MIRIYPNCIPVEGYTNIVFCDLERQCFYVYPKNKITKEQTFPKDGKKDWSLLQPGDMDKEALAFLKKKKTAPQQRNNCSQSTHQEICFL
jgi:hypothetical protein